MNDDARAVRKLLTVFRERPVGLDERRLEQRREKLTPILRQKLVALHTSRARRRSYFSAAAGAVFTLAAAATVFLWVRAPDDARTQRAVEAGEVVRVVVEKGQTLHEARAVKRRILAGDTLREEGEVTTSEHGSLRLRTERGIGLELSSATALTLDGLADPSGKTGVYLGQGEVTCRIPALAPGQQFSVLTPDTRVVVHGTVFAVRINAAPADPDQARTCVRVTEGAVLVYHAGGQVALNGGEQWGCDPTRPAESHAADVRDSPALAQSHDPAATSRLAARDSSEPRGTLAEETRLLQSALAAERTGDFPVATAQLQRLLSRYPSSPLADEARRTLARVNGNASPL